MAIKSSIVISNYWHKPNITVTFKHNHSDSPDGSVHVEIPMEDFLLAIAEEMTHPVKIWTSTALKTDLQNAYKVALEKVKEATNKAV
jgi:hypothetical protein